MTQKQTGRAHATRSKRRQAAVQRRRALARREVAAVERAARRRARIRLGVAAAAVVVLAGAAIAWAVVPDRSHPPQLTAAKVADDPGDRTITASGRTLVATYRVETPSSGADSVTTEVVTVRRPFDARTVFHKGDASDGDVLDDLISTFGKSSQFSAGASAPEVNAVQPDLAYGDTRLDVSIDALVDAKLFVPRERRRLLGRECVVYRTGEPLETRAVSPPTATAYTDVCIDGTGLELEELSVTDGKVTLRVVLTDVKVDEPVPDELFAMADVPPLAPGTAGTTLTPIDTATAPASPYWHLPAPPAGYSLKGRYKVTVTSPAASSASPTTVAPAPTPTPTVTERYVDVYVNGIDVIVVAQGKADAEPPNTASDAPTVDGGRLGSAHLQAGVAGNLLVANPAADWFVHVTATMKPADLQALAATLTT